jgi:hypothetical protein
VHLVKENYPESREGAVRTAEARRAGPPSDGKYVGEHTRKSARLEHLPPAGAEGGEASGGRGVEVAVQVLPSIERPLVAQATVELQ